MAMAENQIQLQQLPWDGDPMYILLYSNILVLKQCEVLFKNCKWSSLAL